MQDKFLFAAVSKELLSNLNGIVFYLSILCVASYLS